jgi:hypothetical protein
MTSSNTIGKLADPGIVDYRLPVTDCGEQTTDSRFQIVT